jgi:GDP-4-dehydro-6-deoxy-D-mannose reductase
MRVLITGVTGFAGSHLVDFLIARDGVDIWGTIRWRSKTDNIDHVGDRLNLFECDLRDSSSVRNLIAESKPDYVFHLAAQSFVPTSWHAPNETLTTNISGTLNIFEAVRSLQIPARILVAGSSEEYGLVLPEEVPVRESNPLRPLSPYAVSKVTADLLGYQYFMSYRLHIIRTRAFNHTGPRRGEVFATSTFAKQVAEIEAGSRPPVINVGNLAAVRDFSDVRDIARAYWLALERGEPGEVYNIASGTGTTIRQVLDTLLEASRISVKIQTDPTRLRPSDVPCLIGDSSKFRATAGWRPEIPLRQTLVDLLDFWRSRIRRGAVSERLGPSANITAGSKHQPANLTSLPSD